MKLDAWLTKMSDWYGKKQYHDIEPLSALIFSTPDTVWGPELTDTQSKAIACWLDGCLRIFEKTKHKDTAKAYQLLQYTSAKLEMAAFDSATDIDIKDWCLKRLQHITVLTLEFCNQQQDQSTWQQEASSTIELHVKLMASLSWNETGTTNSMTPSLSS